MHKMWDQWDTSSCGPSCHAVHTAVVMSDALTVVCHVNICRHCRSDAVLPLAGTHSRQIAHPGHSALGQWHMCMDSASRVCIHRHRCCTCLFLVSTLALRILHFRTHCRHRVGRLVDCEMEWQCHCTHIAIVVEMGSADVLPTDTKASTHRCCVEKRNTTCAHRHIIVD